MFELFHFMRASGLLHAVMSQSGSHPDWMHVQTHSISGAAHAIQSAVHHNVCTYKVLY